jgi:hypothetical protein
MAWETETKPKNPRKARKAKSLQASKLSEALNFIGCASNQAGSMPFQAHARMAGNWIVATDGALCAGHPIEEDMALCPHTGKLVAALNKAGTQLSMTARENGTLLIAGDRLKAIVPCIPGEDIPAVFPDPNVAAISDTIKEGFAKLEPLMKLEADRIVEISLLLRNNSMFSCNGSVIFEYWHGIDLPPWGMALPKPFVQAVAKQSKKLTGFGFSERSVTMYFEDGAWIKTQLYDASQFPDLDALFDFTAYPADVPGGFFEGVRAIESFSEDGAIHFHEGKLKTTYDKYRGEEDGPVYGASFEVPGLQAGHSFSANLLRLIEPVCTSLDYTTIDDRAVFGGDMLRGVIMKRRTPVEAPPPPAIDFSSRDPVADAQAASARFNASIADDPNAGAWASAAGTGWTFNTDLDDDVPF